MSQELDTLYDLIERRIGTADSIRHQITRPSLTTEIEVLRWVQGHINILRQQENVLGRLPMCPVCEAACPNCTNIR